MPRYCDIVMKGGITSGIVYPAAVAEIAKQYRFKNVGGTSAGAIAAALTAAAERRRALDGSDAGFQRLSEVPAYLAADERLFKLFSPNTGTRALFRTVVGLFGRPRFRPAAAAKWLGLVWAFPLAALVGAVPGVAFAIAVVRTYAITEHWLWAFALAIAVVTTVLGMTAAIGPALLRDAMRVLPTNFFGLVTGVDDTDRTSRDALCTWLTDELERTAGLTPGTPLTFGMLWNARSDAAATADLPASPDVNLEMIATNVTWGRPYTFPTTSHQFFFDPQELRRFFPEHVVAWMAAHARAPRDAAEAAHFAAYAPRLPLPEMGDLPVIVATRMSLAFPVLLSAVPLYAVDWSTQAAQGQPHLEKVWFSDGGISSNFPIALFDSPLPRWPTFAINLAGLPPGRTLDPDEAKNVYMVGRNSDGRLPVFRRFEALPGFFSAISDAMQNWNDNTQMVLPGYRDRIVTVFLDASEGGLNLDMPAPVLERLRLRGAAAGTLLASRFAAPSVLDPNAVGMNWENHRWLRFRSTMGAVKNYLSRLDAAWSQPEAPDVSYDALCTAGAGTPAQRYPLDPATRPKVAAIAAGLAQAGATLDAVSEIDRDLPQPPPHLSVHPNLKA
ncbi:MAG: patatin-like phospholipase family protein [Candidatus Eremiobacteraeota bacterium]|nr:patatin-like phospholipase family protein [Candidatus Eremiobacteraeota bacterium]